MLKLVRLAMRNVRQVLGEIQVHDMFITVQYAHINQAVSVHVLVTQVLFVVQILSYKKRILLMIFF